MASLLACASDPAGLPEKLRVAADSGAARFGNEAGAHRQYLDSFRRGVVDALIWGEQIGESRAASAAACERGGDLQLRILECGYADGVDAVMAGTAAVTLVDLGYRPSTIMGRVASAADSQLRLVETTHQRPWLLLSSPVADRLETDACYRLDGYLAPGAPDPLRYPDFSSQFIVFQSVPMSSCNAPAVR